MAASLGCRPDTARLRPVLFPIAFRFVPAASDVGAKFALRAHFEDESPNPAGVGRVGDGRGGTDADGEK